MHGLSMLDIKKLKGTTQPLKLLPFEVKVENPCEAILIHGLWAFLLPFCQLSRHCFAMGEFALCPTYQTLKVTLHCKLCKRGEVKFH